MKKNVNSILVSARDPTPRIKLRLFWKLKNNSSILSMQKEEIPEVRNSNLTVEMKTYFCRGSIAQAQAPGFLDSRSHACIKSVFFSGTRNISDRKSMCDGRKSTFDASIRKYYLSRLSFSFILLGLGFRKNSRQIVKWRRFVWNAAKIDGGKRQQTETKVERRMTSL